MSPSAERRRGLPSVRDPQAITAFAGVLRAAGYESGRLGERTGGGDSLSIAPERMPLVARMVGDDALGVLARLFL
ncbi:MAG: hypothetical protein FJ034_05650, partial [Chloroflexi bacterium]|nr:hypothetical protein [Chloroflexota bacterium]